MSADIKTFLLFLTVTDGLFAFPSYTYEVEESFTEEIFSIVAVSLEEQESQALYLIPSSVSVAFFETIHEEYLWVWFCLYLTVYEAAEPSLEEVQPDCFSKL